MYFLVFGNFYVERMGIKNNLCRNLLTILKKKISDEGKFYPILHSCWNKDFFFFKHSANFYFLSFARHLILRHHQFPGYENLFAEF